MPGRFVLRKSRTGQYFFTLNAANGEIILVSDRYATKAAARQGIEALKRQSQGAALEESESALGQAQAAVEAALAAPKSASESLQPLIDALARLETEIESQRTSSVTVRTDLQAPAFHQHDEVTVPMSVEASPIGTDFDDDGASFSWTVTYRCPQCGSRTTVNASVSVDVDIQPREARPPKVTFTHGNGPGRRRR